MNNQPLQYESILLWTSYSLLKDMKTICLFLFFFLKCWNAWFYNTAVHHHKFCNSQVLRSSKPVDRLLRLINNWNRLLLQLELFDAPKGSNQWFPTTIFSRSAIYLDFLPLSCNGVSIITRNYSAHHSFL